MSVTDPDGHADPLGARMMRIPATGVCRIPATGVCRQSEWDGSRCIYMQTCHQVKQTSSPAKNTCRRHLERFGHFQAVLDAADMSSIYSSISVPPAKSPIFSPAHLGFHALAFLGLPWAQDKLTTGTVCVRMHTHQSFVHMCC